MTTPQWALSSKAAKYGVATAGDSVSGGTNLLTPGAIMAVAGVAQAREATVAEVIAGLGLAGLTAGALLFASGAAAVDKLPLGTAGRVLVAGASAPAWSDDRLSYSAGVVTLGNNTNAGGYVVNGPSGGVRSWCVIQSAGLTAWGLFVRDATNDLHIRAYDDAGAAIDYPLTIARTAGGAITLTRPLVGTSLAASSWGVFGAAARLASEAGRFAGGTMGTPGATDVLLAGGKVYAGDTSATSIQTAGSLRALGNSTKIGDGANTPALTSTLHVDRATTNAAVITLQNATYELAFGCTTATFFGSRSATDLYIQRAGSNMLAITSTAVDLTAGVVYKINGTQVVGARNTGWTAQTATASKADLGASPTNAAIASFCRSLYDAMAGHGLIGT